MLSDHQSVTSKQMLHNELQLRYKEFFESHLAIHFLNYPVYFQSVKKISAKILALLINNKSIVLRAINDNQKIIAELSAPYFGSCFADQQKISAEEAFDTMLSILKEQNTPLSLVMELHCIFIHRIYDLIEQKPEKNTLVKTLFFNTHFSSDNRSRVERQEAAQTTTTLGISRHPVFTKMLPKANREHMRAVDKYEKNTSIRFFANANDKLIPTVCGASGHTGSLLLGAKLYGELTADELSEYAFACFTFLTAGGNHSFYEVYVVANLLGVSFDSDDYANSIPAPIKTTQEYKEIERLYPQYLK